MLSVNLLYRNSYRDSFDSLYESILNDFDVDNINPLFEVSIDAPRYFKQLEIDLDVFTKKKYREFSKVELKQTAKQLNKTLKQILNIPVEVLIGKYETCGVYPEFNFTKKDIKLDKNKKPILEESLLRVESAYFFLDIKLFMYKLKLTPAEMVGVLLHEIGHITYHKSFISVLFVKIFRFIKSSSVFDFLRYIFKKITSIIILNQLYILFLAIIFIFTRTLSFFEHKEEYHCDKFAAKYGYGDELASAFIKLGNYTGSISKNKSRGIFKKIVDFIKTIFNSSTHPDEINRICTIAEKLKIDYIKSYPKIKTTLERDLNRLGC